MSQNKTAILFFSRTLNDEFHAKSFGLTRKRFARLYQFFVNKTLTTARASGLPIIEVYSNRQKGNSFAERLIYALEETKSNGFSRVIVIGNDSPELTTRDLLLAEEALILGKQVLGKNTHGGTYLIGLDLELIDPFQLTHIAWHSANAYGQLKTLLGDAFELDALWDLNELKDIKTLIISTKALSRNVLSLLIMLLKGSIERKVYLRAPDHLVLQNYLLRGPPALIC